MENFRNWRTGAIITGSMLIVGLLFLMIGLAGSNWPGMNLPTTCDPATAVSNHLEEAGFAEGTFVVNPTNQLTTGDAATHRGDAAFNQAGIYSNEALADYLSSNDPNAAKAQEIINERLAGRTVSWVPVYFAVAVNIEGNLGIGGEGVVSFGTTNSGAGELIWFPVDQANCQVVDGLIIRAGCANPGDRVVPVCTENCTPCPPGNTIPSCAPKSSNPDDYTYPDGKPPVTVTTPPESSPPPVVTEQTGGGGVVDTPTNDPGSETGVTAPGSDPAPTTPSIPPVNQGGDNGAGDPGGF